MKILYYTALCVIAATGSAVEQCGFLEVPCLDGSNCVGPSSFCNGIQECNDGFDEPWRNKNIPEDSGTQFCRGSTHFICVLPKQLIPFKALLCRGDEKCRPGEYPCADKSACLPSKGFCDGVLQCPDGSDETNLKSINEYDDDAVFCRGQRGDVCVLREELSSNADRPYCKDKWPCDTASDFQCADGSWCIASNRFCNGVWECRDGSDENLRNKGRAYGANLTFCRGSGGHICVIDTQLQPTMNSSCDPDWECKRDEYPCADGSRCIPAGDFCNGVQDCGDGSDEVTRDRTSKYDATVVFYHAGSDRICAMPADLPSFDETICENITRQQMCFGGRYGGMLHSMASTADVFENISSYLLNDGRFRCLSLPAFIISASQLCDGIVNCPDLSDECVCSANNRVGICNSMQIDSEAKPRSQPFISCPSRNFTQGVIVESNRVCDNRSDCVDNDDEIGCNELVRQQNKVKRYKCVGENKYAIKCDRIPECKYFVAEECEGCPNNVELCDRIAANWKRYLPCMPTPTTLSKMCDGFGDCVDNLDEQLCHARRFYCTKDPIPNIPLEKRCDRHDDCENEADEKDCDHFLCNDNGTVKYIQQTYTCDGFQDCDTGRDECTSCVEGVFSDDVSMIRDTAVLIVVWIMSVAAVIGCFIVAIVTVRDLRQPEKSKGMSTAGHTKLMKVQILSLSISDLLVAMYTLVICIKAVQFNEDYCKEDRVWRSGKTCAALGALLVIGSEQSVFTMVFIAIARLMSVLRPFSKPNIPQAILGLMVTWIAAIILGIFPLIPSAEDWFLKSIWFNRNQLLKVVYQNETNYFIKWLGMMHQNQIVGDDYGATDWSKIRRLATDLKPDLTIAYEFGYYSSHTVCLPTLFPNPSEENAWGYTLLLLIINFVAFVSMLVVYVILYRRATKSKAVLKESALHEKRQKQNLKMQRKLTRIVASDFLCWMPICIMGFLQIFGVQIPPDAYIPAGLLIIPINSALNPLLYSDLPEMALEKLNVFKRKICCNSSNELEAE